jgi:hypothetical protein
MRTQSNVESVARPTPAAIESSPETVSFRADTLDAAVALAEESLGAPVRVVAANRIRRGGIGGFFASDLGVEVSVTLDDETIEEALERLVAETAVDERTRWLEHRAADAPRRAPTARHESEPVAPVHAAAAAALAAPGRSSLGTPQPADSVVRIAQRDEEPSMVRVEQIIEELAFLTRRTEHELDSPAQAPVAPPRTVALPTLPPRPVDIARAASTNALASQVLAIAEEHELARREAAPSMKVTPSSKSLATPSGVVAMPRPPRPAEIAPQPSNPHTEVVDLDITADVSNGEEGAAAPSQRQVELAVAATDQLIESLQREVGMKRLSVRVVLRTSDQSAVEAAAEWEAS